MFLSSSPVVFDTKCEHLFKGSINRNLKIRPNFSQHSKIKISNDVKKLRIQMKPASSIFAGIGESFRNLEKLDLGELSTDSGSIQFIERADFANMQQLRELGLNENPINFIPEDVFWDLHNLEGLHMWNCKIENLPKDIFKNMKKLKFLYLGENKITQLDKDLFKNNLQLERINLFASKLSFIGVDFTKLTKISWMSLFGNECINERYIPNGGQYSTVESVQEIQDKIKSSCSTKAL